MSNNLYFCTNGSITLFETKESAIALWSSGHFYYEKEAINFSDQFKRMNVNVSFIRKNEIIFLVEKDRSPSYSHPPLWYIISSDKIGWIAASINVVNNIQPLIR